MVLARVERMPGPVASWTDSEKLEAAIRRSTKYLPASLGHQVESLLTPENLAIMSGTIAVWAGSHLFGVGEAVDVGLLLVGAFCIGWSIEDVMRELWAFGTTAIHARSDEDLDQAGRAFASAIVTAGVTAVMALLLRRSAKEISVRGPSWVDAARPQKPGLVGVGTDPRPGELWSKPTATGDPAMAAETGSTTAFGDVTYSTAGTAAQQEVARIHELGHSLLAPRFRPLRTFRARVAMSGYVRSALLKYLEEALVETVAQLRVNGVSAFVDGITFPVRHGYMKFKTIPIGTAAASEGANIGTIAVGGQRFSVLFISEPPPRQHRGAHH